MYLMLTFIYIIPGADIPCHCADLGLGHKQIIFRTPVFLKYEMVSVTPNTQHGGPGAVLRLVPPLRPVRHGYSRLVTDDTRVLEIKLY